MLVLITVLFSTKTFGELSRFCCSIRLDYGDVKVGLRVVPVQLKVQLVLAEEGAHLEYMSHHVSDRVSKAKPTWTICHIINTLFNQHHHGEDMRLSISD